MNIVNFLQDPNNLPKLIGFAAAGGLVVFTFGYLIGTFTFFILGSFFRVINKGLFFKSWYHEVCLSDGTLEQLWNMLLNNRHATQKKKRSQEFLATVVFDYGVLANRNPEIHQWLVRRWSAISINSSSAVGLIFSLFLGRCNPVVPITWKLGWLVPVVIFAFMFSVVAFFAWRDTKQLLTFTIQMTELWHQSQVRLRAHKLWENANRPVGTALADWLQAEAEVAAERSSLFLNMVDLSK